MDEPLLQADLETGSVLPDHASQVDSSGKDDAAADEDAWCQVPGPAVYFSDILRLLVFYYAIVSDALLLKELWGQQHTELAVVATGFTVGPHVVMSLLLIVRQGWLQAASQACGFILTINPLENLTPLPHGIFGLFVLSIGFIAYVLIAASGLIFVAYCVLCYLVTALLFSLLILDLAALVITVAPSKAIFKYTDLVYTENFKFSRLVLQAWLQSVPELVLIAFILYRDASSRTQAAAVDVSWPILLQALIAHSINVWDKTQLVVTSAHLTGGGAVQQLAAVLQIRGSYRLSWPVLKENLSRVLHSAEGTMGSVLCISSHENTPSSSDSDEAASMVPEYLTPTNGGQLSAGQLMALVRVVFQQYGGPGVTELLLDITPDVAVGKLLLEVVHMTPNASSVRLVNAAVGGRDANMLAAALLGCGNLRTLQLHQVSLDKRGAQGLVYLLEHTPTLQQLDLCRSHLCRSAPQLLAQGLRSNKTLRQLNLAGCKNLDEAGICAIAAAVSTSKVFCALNLAFVKLSVAAAESLAQVMKHSSSLQVLVVSQNELPVESARRLLVAVSRLCSSAGPQRPPPPSVACNLTLGTFPVHNLDKVQWLAVPEQDALMEAWQGLAADASSLEGDCDWQQAAAAAAAGLAGSPQDVAAAGGVAAVVSDVAAVEAAAMIPPLSISGPPAAAGSSSNDTSRRLKCPAVPSFASSSSGVRAAASTPPFARSSPNSSDSSSSIWAAPTPPPCAPIGCSSSNPAGFKASSSSPAAAAPASTSCDDASCGGSSRSAGAAAALLPQGSQAVQLPDDDAGGRCPTLVFVVTQEEVVSCMVKVPLLFEALETLDLTGLGIGDDGAAAMAQVLAGDPPLRRCVLSDNKIGTQGAAALAKALASNTQLQVLDISGNEFDDAGADALIDGLRHASAGLKELRLMGNLIPFGLSTLCKLLGAEAASPQCRVALIEEPEEILNHLQSQGSVQQAHFFQLLLEQQQQRQRQRQQQWAAAAAASRGDAQQQLSHLGGGEIVVEADDAAAAAAAAMAACSTAAAGAYADDDSGGVVHADAAAKPPPPPAAALGGICDTTAKGDDGSSTAEEGGSSPCGGPTSTCTGDDDAAAAACACAEGQTGGVSVDDADTCGICFDNSNHVAIKYCGHMLCVDCYRRMWEMNSTAPACPFCRSRLDGYVYLCWPVKI